MSGSAKPVEILSQVYMLAGQRDWDGVAGLTHPDFTLCEAEGLPFGGEWKGKDALKRCLAAMTAAWAEISIEIHEIIGGERYAVTVLSLTMTSKRTGNTFTQTVNEMAQFEDGMIKSLHIHYFDVAQVIEEAAL